MAAKLTPKQEQFCQKYIETGNASKAYRQSYNAGKMKAETINRKAKALLDNGKIGARLEALHERGLKRHDITVDSLTGMYMESYEMGKKLWNAAAMKGAADGLAKLYGYGAEKHEHSGPGGGPIKHREIIRSVVSS